MKKVKKVKKEIKKFNNYINKPYIDNETLIDKIYKYFSDSLRASLNKLGE